MIIFFIKTFAAATLYTYANALPALPIQSVDQWQDVLRTVPVPGIGCFVASFPDAVWHEVPCVEDQVEPEVVGGGFDWMAKLPSGTVNYTKGSISLSGVTSETDSSTGSNRYSLQTNTNRFVTSLCNGALNPTVCRGWQQFVYTSRGSQTGYVQTQYWLINYNNSCPAGWLPYGSGNCWTVGANINSVPPQAGISSLNGMSLEAQVMQFYGIFITSITLYSGGTAYGTGNSDTMNLGPPGVWTGAEFNVLGEANGSRANFNAGSTVSVDLVVNNGPSALNCVNASSLGSVPSETNNLQLSPSCGVITTPQARIYFYESN